MTGESVAALLLLPPPRPRLCTEAHMMLAGAKVKVDSHLLL